jgi:hypothetical protein
MGQGSPSAPGPNQVEGGRGPGRTGQGWGQVGRCAVPGGVGRLEVSSLAQLWCGRRPRGPGSRGAQRRPGRRSRPPAPGAAVCRPARCAQGQPSAGGPVGSPPTPCKRPPAPGRMAASRAAGKELLPRRRGCGQGPAACPAAAHRLRVRVVVRDLAPADLAFHCPRGAAGCSWGSRLSKARFGPQRVGMPSRFLRGTMAINKGPSPRRLELPARRHGWPLRSSVLLRRVGAGAKGPNGKPAAGAGPASAYGTTGPSCLGRGASFAIMTAGWQGPFQARTEEGRVSG